MPNWCSNSLTITPKDNDKKTLIELKAFYFENKGAIDGEASELTFSSSVPVPKNLTGEQAYDYRVNKWGTKWEPYEVYFENRGDELNYTFQTAWAPPIQWAEKTSKLYPNLIFSLEFEEPGVGLFGGIQASDGDVSEWENDQPGEGEEIDSEEAYDILVDGDTIMIKGYDPNEPRLYAGVTMDDFEGMTKEEIIKQLDGYDSVQHW